MSGRIKEMVILLIYAISINVILFYLVNSGIDFECGELGNYDLTTNETSYTSIVNIALNRCKKLPAWIFYIFELPIIVGLLYILRMFVGAT